MTRYKRGNRLKAGATVSSDLSRGFFPTMNDRINSLHSCEVTLGFSIYQTK